MVTSTKEGEKTVYFTEYPSPLGTLLLTAEEDCLTGLWMDTAPPVDGSEGANHPILLKAKKWLDAYFRGDAPEIDFPLNPKGTAFQKQVWQILLTIPLGKVRTYGSIAREMAEKLGKEKMSAQAVGQAVGANPISIIIPCHRVVGAKGQLTGYAGGIDKKIWLLSHEGWLEGGKL